MVILIVQFCKGSHTQKVQFQTDFARVHTPNMSNFRLLAEKMYVCDLHVYHIHGFKAELKTYFFQAFP